MNQSRIIQISLLAAVLVFTGCGSSSSSGTDDSSASGPIGPGVTLEGPGGILVEVDAAAEFNSTVVTIERVDDPQLPLLPPPLRREGEVWSISADGDQLLDIDSNIWVALPIPEGVDVDASPSIAVLIDGQWVVTPGAAPDDPNREGAGIAGPFWDIQRGVYDSVRNKLVIPYGLLTTEPMLVSVASGEYWHELDDASEQGQMLTAGDFEIDCAGASSSHCTTDVVDEILEGMLEAGNRFDSHGFKNPRLTRTHSYVACSGGVCSVDIGPYEVTLRSYYVDSAGNRLCDGSTAPAWYSSGSRSISICQWAEDRRWADLDVSGAAGSTVTLELDGEQAVWTVPASSVDSSLRLALWTLGTGFDISVGAVASGVRISRADRGPFSVSTSDSSIVSINRYADYSWLFEVSAHELFHAVQFAYGAFRQNQGWRWQFFTEGTARIAELSDDVVVRTRNTRRTIDPSLIVYRNKAESEDYSAHEFWVYIARRFDLPLGFVHGILENYDGMAGFRDFFDDQGMAIEHMYYDFVRNQAFEGQLDIDTRPWASECSPANYDQFIEVDETILSSDVSLPLEPWSARLVRVQIPSESTDRSFRLSVDASSGVMAKIYRPNTIGTDTCFVNRVRSNIDVTIPAEHSWMTYALVVNATDDPRVATLTAGQAEGLPTVEITRPAPGLEGRENRPFGATASYDLGDGSAATLEWYLLTEGQTFQRYRQSVGEQSLFSQSGIVDFNPVACPVGNVRLVAALYDEERDLLVYDEVPLTVDEWAEARMQIDVDDGEDVSFVAPIHYLPVGFGANSTLPDLTLMASPHAYVCPRTYAESSIRWILDGGGVTYGPERTVVDSDFRDSEGNYVSREVRVSHSSIGAATAVLVPCGYSVSDPCPAPSQQYDRIQDSLYEILNDLMALGDRNAILLEVESRLDDLLGWPPIDEYYPPTLRGIDELIYVTFGDVFAGFFRDFESALDADHHLDVPRQLAGLFNDFTYEMSDDHTALAFDTVTLASELLVAFDPDFVSPNSVWTRLPDDEVSRATQWTSMNAARAGVAGFTLGLVDDSTGEWMHDDASLDKATDIAILTSVRSVLRDDF